MIWLFTLAMTTSRTLLKAAFLVALVFLQRALPSDAFPEPYDSQQGDDRPIPAVEAAAALAVPDGFRVQLLAAEPTLRNPIAVSQDARGRLWVAENFTYAEGRVRFDRTLRDRVLVFDDADGDGRLDQPVVFSDNLQLLTSVAVGYGGVWLCCPPQILFIPDADGDLVPDGPAEVVLDGFDIGPSSHHNFANGLAFGPDGWLYGRCGHSCPARVGLPGTPDRQRYAMEGGLWRYHVHRKQVEVLTTGTTNPWGHDWTAEGECFFVNTVNGHLWHMIPGAHFAQANGIDPNPLTYELIDQHADHYHFDMGAGWQASRDGAANSFGGGHAHSGCLIYQGASWPDAYHGKLFTLNFHGRRINQESLERQGSGYVAKHEPDFAVSSDSWFRGIDLTTRPDGSVVVLDWSDTGECHEHDGVHRSSGRLYEIRHEHSSMVSSKVDLRACSDAELAQFQGEPSGWHAHQARLMLAERAAARPIDADAVQHLREQLASGEQIDRDRTLSASAVVVRALLTLHACRALSQSDLIDLADHADEHCRTWVVRLLSETWPLDAALGPVFQNSETAARVNDEATQLLPLFIRMARDDASGLVRLALASTLQRLPLSHRPALAAALVSRHEDAADHNLPLMVWYALIPVADADPAALAPVFQACRWPNTRRLIARRLAEQSDGDGAPLDRVLRAAAESADAATMRDVLVGCADAWRGWRRVPQPASWEAVAQAIPQLAASSEAEDCRLLAAELADLFGQGQPLDVLVEIAVDRSQPLTAREAAVRSLQTANRIATVGDSSESETAQARESLRKVCEKLVGDRYLAGVAAQGLAAFDDDHAAQLIVEAYRRATRSDQGDILALLVSRSRYAQHLLDAIEQGRVAASALTAYHIRQLHALGNEPLTAQAERLWGRVQEQTSDTQARVAAWTARLADTDSPTSASLSRGRAVYQQTCSSCHRLFGVGGDLGPDLTGSGRHDLSYLAENLLNPSGVVNRDWRLSILELEDGRVLSGVVAEERDRTVTLITPTERIVLDREEIAMITPTDRSPMPEGLLDQLSDNDVRDLVGYLRHPVQVPLP
jgi:putative membrane-bound dehydrogenase-like protein